MGEQTRGCSRAEVIININDCSRVAYCLRRSVILVVDFVIIVAWLVVIRRRISHSFDIITATQEAGEIFTFTAFSAADIIVDDLCESSQAYRFVAFDWTAVILFISHSLDISFKTLVHIVEFKLFLFSTIRYKTGLDKIVTSELDSGKAATILWLTELYHNSDTHDILDDG